MNAGRRQVHIEPSGPLGGYVRVPPSKNYTTRIILAAALAEGRSRVRQPAVNDDARALVACCRKLGAKIEEEGGDLDIEGVAGRPANPGRLNPGNAGAVLRLLLGTACLCKGEVMFETDHPDSLGRRPNEDLLAALRRLGAEAEGIGPEGRLPIRIAGGPDRLRTGATWVSGANSSQYLSSLLFLTPHLEVDTRIEVGSPEDRQTEAGPQLVSRPLIEQTREVLQGFGCRIEADLDGLGFDVRGGEHGIGGPHVVNGDWPSAAALLAAVAVAGGMVKLYGLSEDMQGERRAREAFETMGCAFMEPEPGELLIHSKGRLGALAFNGDLATDAVLALVGAACLAEGTSRFTGVGNLRLKECDRIREPLEELARIGVAASHGKDWIEIEGRPGGYEGGLEVDARGDHRVAQMLAIVGTRCRGGLTIRGAECVSKSYPGFFEDLGRMGVLLDRR